MTWQKDKRLVWTTKKVKEESKSERDSEFQSRETYSSEDAAGSEKEPELNRPTPSNCTAECCFSTEKAFQLTDKGTLATFSAIKRNSQVVQTISLGKCLHYLQKGVLPLLSICNMSPPHFLVAVSASDGIPCEPASHVSSLIPRSLPSFLSLAVRLSNRTASDRKLGKVLGTRLTCGTSYNGMMLSSSFHCYNTNSNNHNIFSNTLHGVVG